MGAEIDYSIIIPVFNEEDSVSPLFYSLKEVMGELGGGYEIIFINDGSTDFTLKLLRELSMAHNTLRIVSFDLNKGQGKAMEEGFRSANGKIIISMDGDLQDDPKDIPKLIFEIKQGFDLACGWRYARCDTLMKKIKSRLGNYVQRKVTGLDLHDISCTMRAYRKEIVGDITLNGKYYFSMLPYIISSKNNIKMTEVKINHDHRKFGRTKYVHLYTICGTIFDFIRVVFTYKKLFK